MRESVCVPLVERSPDQPPVATQDDASLAFQVSFALPPSRTEVALVLKVSVGALGSGTGSSTRAATFTDTERLTEPPGPVQTRA